MAGCSQIIMRGRSLGRKSSLTVKNFPFKQPQLEAGWAQPVNEGLAANSAIGGGACPVCILTSFSFSETAELATGEGGGAAECNRRKESKKKN